MAGWLSQRKSKAERVTRLMNERAVMHTKIAQELQHDSTCTPAASSSANSPLTDSSPATGSSPTDDSTPAVTNPRTVGVQLAEGERLGVGFNATSANHLEIVGLRESGIGARFPELRVGLVLTRIGECMAADLTYAQAMEKMRTRPLELSFATAAPHRAAASVPDTTCLPTMRRSNVNRGTRKAWSKHRRALPRSLTLGEANSMWTSFDASGSPHQRKRGCSSRSPALIVRSCSLDNGIAGVPAHPEEHPASPPSLPSFLSPEKRKLKLDLGGSASRQLTFVLSDALEPTSATRYRRAMMTTPTLRSAAQLAVFPTQAAI